MHRQPQQPPGSAAPARRVADADAHHRRTQSVPVQPADAAQNAPGIKSVKRGSWFNPETLINEKREWSDQFKDKKKVVEWPKHNFEHFVVVGLPPATEVQPSAADFGPQGRRTRSEGLEGDGPPRPENAFGDPLPGQILFSYPPEKPVEQQLVSFCFPHGIQAKLLPRTPDMSALQDLMYSQRYQQDDALSFVFLMKAADNLPLYGVCCYVEEMVHRPPPMLASQFPEHTKPLSRILVAAPRCYAFLTNFPFFSLHMKVLHMMLGLERADRTRIFSEELVDERGVRSMQSAMASRARPPPRDLRSGPSSVHSDDQRRLPPVSQQQQRSQLMPTVAQGRQNPSPEQDAPCIPLVPAGEESGLQKAQSEDLESTVNVQRILDALGDVDHDDLSELAGLVDEEELEKKKALATPGYAELTAMVRNKTIGNSAGGSGSQRQATVDAAERAVTEEEAEQALQGRLRSGNYGRAGNGMPPQVARAPSIASSMHSQGSGAGAIRRASARLKAVAVANSSSGQQEEWQEQQDSGEQPYPEQPEAAPQEGEQPFFRTTSFELPDEEAHAAEAGQIQPIDMTEPSTAMALKVMYSYYCNDVPDAGKEWEFKPDPSLQSLQYYRPKVGHGSDGVDGDPNKVSISTAEAEAAEGLCTWTVATLCSALTLPNILTLLTAVLLERQTVVFCPNMGVLTAVVLALTPLVRPFAWQSLLLPVLPCTEEHLDLLQAPVPFLVGMQHKTAEVSAMVGGLVRVNVTKDRVKGAHMLPALPNDKLLMQKLMPSYNVLSNIGRRQAHGQPLYAVSGIQRTAAEGFLQNMRQYLTGLTANLAKHTITDVKLDQRISVLLKDSFIESFAPRERQFVRQFVETQMFTEYVDAVID